LLLQFKSAKEEKPYSGNTKGGSITVLLTSCSTGLESAVNICFYLQNRQIQTSQTGGQRYSDTSPFSIPCQIAQKNEVKMPMAAEPAYLAERSGVEPSLRFVHGPLLDDADATTLLSDGDRSDVDNVTKLFLSSLTNRQIS